MLQGRVLVIEVQCCGMAFLTKLKRSHQLFLLKGYVSTHTANNYPSLSRDVSLRVHMIWGIFMSPKDKMFSYAYL